MTQDETPAVAGDRLRLLQTVRDCPWLRGTGRAAPMVVREERRQPGTDGPLETTKPPVARRLVVRDPASVPDGRSVGQWEQPLGAPPSSAVRKLEPQPQAATAFGLLTVKPAPMRVST